MIPLGYLSEDDKLAAMAAADVYVHPSPNESFSIVMMEAWLQGTPALVWGLCEVTRYHVAKSGGGLWFSSFPEFDVAIGRLLEDGPLARHMARGGARYVRDEFSWEAVVTRVQDSLEKWIS
jgi:glycosyltransferase involved in cell wall biosynthesis